jgi:hypothetical protein
VTLCLSTDLVLTFSTPCHFVTMDIEKGELSEDAKAVPSTGSNHSLAEGMVKEKLNPLQWLKALLHSKVAETRGIDRVPPQQRLPVRPN